MSSTKWNKNKTLDSPYTQSMNQYPSQSENYLPFMYGGNNQQTSTPVKYQNPRQRQSGNFGSNGQNWHQRNNSNQRYYNNTGSSPSNRNKQNPYNRNQHQENHQNQYFHPSMLEDPWKTLMIRHNSIANSEVQENNQIDGKKSEST